MSNNSGNHNPQRGHKSVEHPEVLLQLIYALELLEKARHPAIQLQRPKAIACLQIRIINDKHQNRRNSGMSNTTGLIKMQNKKNAS